MGVAGVFGGTLEVPRVQQEASMLQLHGGAMVTMWN